MDIALEDGRPTSDPCMDTLVYTVNKKNASSLLGLIAGKFV